ncbi:MAG: hypothetical protein CMJ30_04675 [Phycisphaerae bacterium]|nr:hypothetical protein [Phycisphaerae bacterium]
MLGAWAQVEEVLRNLCHSVVIRDGYEILLHHCIMGHVLGEIGGRKAASAATRGGLGFLGAPGAALSLPRTLDDQ